MQKIINGIVCNTEKAELIATSMEGKLSDDKYWYQKTYHTEDDHYFRYVQSNTDPQYEHGKIILISSEETLSYWFKKKKGNSNG